MDHDSRGNIYILGEFGVGATINGTSLLPMAPYGPNNKTVNTLIAKMSPSGELLWSKALHSNNGQHNHCRDMHIIGDTSLVCVVDVCLPASGTNYLYYLDTLLLQDDNNYLVPMDSIDGTDMTAFISFDLNGNVQEQHFICAAFIDSVGNLMTSSYVLGIQSNRAQTKGGQCFSFDIDNEGNIIIARYTQDMWHVRTAPNTYVEHSVWNGKIAGVRFYIDGIRHLTYFPQNRPNQWNINILKFSPHFENLLYSQYLIQPDSSHVLNSTSQHNDIKLMHDDSNNVYAVGYLMTSSSDFLINGLPLDTLPTAGISYFGFLVRYDTSLSPEYVQYVKNNNNDYRYWASTFNNATIQDSNIYISASNDKSPMYHDSEESQLSMGDTNLDLIHNACFFRLNKENGELISYGKAESGSHTRNLYSDIIVSNNRVFELVSYLSDLRLPDTTFNAQGTNYENGLMIWSCDGHPLEYIDFQASHPDNEIGTLTLHDSAIYIGGMLYGAAQFDTIPISCQRSTALIAKYIDSTFLSPYRNDNDPIDPGDVSITVVEDGTALVAYPNPFRQSVRIKVQGGQLKEHKGTITAILTDLTGRREEVRLVPEGTASAHSSNQAITQSSNHTYTLDLTSRPQSTYLLTLTTSTGQTHTVRLLKQSDIFGQ